MFNEGCYLERIRSRELHPGKVKDKHPAPLKSGQPWCTHSQFITYLDANDQEVVRVFQYWREDGSLGASGIPDPKRLIVDGIIYYT